MDYTSVDSYGGGIVSVGCEFVGIFGYVPLHDALDRNLH